jgi:hypothetical protein
MLRLLSFSGSAAAVAAAAGGVAAAFGEGTAEAAAGGVAAAWRGGVRAAADLAAARRGAVTWVERFMGLHQSIKA